MEFKDILNTAFNIAVDTKFSVNFISKETIEYKEMSYMELGLFLNTNSKNIDKIEITLKE